MSYLFAHCTSLIHIPDISKWSSSNTLSFNRMFYNCKSLVSIPDISKWKTSNIIEMDNMFQNCQSLTVMPDITVWDTKNCNIEGMFEGCNENLYMNVDESLITI